MMQFLARIGSSAAQPSAPIPAGEGEFAGVSYHIRGAGPPLVLCRCSSPRPQTTVADLLARDPCNFTADFASATPPQVFPYGTPGQTGFNVNIDLNRPRQHRDNQPRLLHTGRRDRNQYRRTGASIGAPCPDEPHERPGLAHRWSPVCNQPILSGQRSRLRSSYSTIERRLPLYRQADAWFEHRTYRRRVLCSHAVARGCAVDGQCTAGERSTSHAAR